MEVYLRESRGQDFLAFLKSQESSAAFVGYYVFVYAAIFYGWNKVAAREGGARAELKNIRPR
jgi:hypothetical protein